MNFKVAMQAMHEEVRAEIHSAVASALASLVKGIEIKSVDSVRTVDAQGLSDGATLHTKIESSLEEHARPDCRNPPEKHPGIESMGAGVARQPELPLPSYPAHCHLNSSLAPDASEDSEGDDANAVVAAELARVGQS